MRAVGWEKDSTRSPVKVVIDQQVIRRKSGKMPQCSSKELKGSSRRKFRLLENKRNPFSLQYPFVARNRTTICDDYGNWLDTMEVREIPFVFKSGLGQRNSSGDTVQGYPLHILGYPHQTTRANQRCCYASRANVASPTNIQMGTTAILMLFWSSREDMPSQLDLVIQQRESAPSLDMIRGSERAEQDKSTIQSADIVSTEGVHLNMCIFGLQRLKHIVIHRISDRRYHPITSIAHTTDKTRSHQPSLVEYVNIWARHEKKPTYQPDSFISHASIIPNLHTSYTTWQVWRTILPSVSLTFSVVNQVGPNVFRDSLITWLIVLSKADADISFVLQEARIIGNPTPTNGLLVNPTLNNKYLNLIFSELDCFFKCYTLLTWIVEAVETTKRLRICLTKCLFIHRCCSKWFYSLFLCICVLTYSVGLPLIPQEKKLCEYYRPPTYNNWFQKTKRASVVYVGGFVKACTTALGVYENSLFLFFYLHNLKIRVGCVSKNSGKSPEIYFAMKIKLNRVVSSMVKALKLDSFVFFFILPPGKTYMNHVILTDIVFSPDFINQQVTPAKLVGEFLSSYRDSFYKPFYWAKSQLAIILGLKLKSHEQASRPSEKNFLVISFALRTTLSCKMILTLKAASNGLVQGRGGGRIVHDSWG
ncbi:hypothetical protein VP01_319g2 [Puccinia sorghi]|uniref:Uncharacterized protein n=1 Tax=Puccinia sorghi TaxID=27349 RepID=A0A0L6UYE5_9BASI|nr:hypothetical protein VP01_319g2 [Puccinia sorghi]